MHAIIVMNETPHFPFFMGLKGALIKNLIPTAKLQL